MHTLDPNAPCFPEQQPHTPLPRPLAKSVLESDIRQRIEAIRTGNIDTKFPRPQHSAKNQKQTGRLRELEKKLISDLQLQEGAPTIRTFQELRKLASNARESLREGTRQNIEYPDRSMDREVTGAVMQAFNLYLIEQRRGIQAALDGKLTDDEKKQEHSMKLHANMEALMRKLPSDVLAQLKNLQGRLIVSGDESVTDESAELFMKFMLCVETAVGNTSEEDLRFATTNIIAEHSTGDEFALLVSWTDACIPQKIPNMDPKIAQDPSQWRYVKRTNRNGYVTHPQALLMPKKIACMQERQTEDGEPNWTMTADEREILRAFWQQKKTVNGDQWDLLTDNDFLREATDQANEQCNGQLALLRADREVFMELRAFEAELRLAKPGKNGSAASPKKGPPDALENPLPAIQEHVMAEVVGQTLRATERIAGTRISKGDQIVRQLFKDLHIHLANRQEALWNAPQTTTAFDEFALQFLRTMTGSGGSPLIRMGPDGKSVMFDQNFDNHMQGGKTILDHLAQRLPPANPQEQVRVRGSARQYVERVTQILAMTTPLAKKYESTDEGAPMDTNKYISQAMLLHMHTELEAALAVLSQHKTLPQGMSEEYLECLLAFGEACGDIYAVSPGKNELMSKIPQRDFAAATIPLMKTWRENLEQGTRLLTTHKPRMEIEQQGTMIDTEGLEHGLQHREHALQQQLDEVGAELSRQLLATYRELKALELQLQSFLQISPDDADLQQWNKNIGGQCAALFRIFPDGNKPENPPAKKISITKLPDEVQRIHTQSAQQMAAVKTAATRQKEIRKELEEIGQQREALKRIAGLQNELQESLATYKKLADLRKTAPTSSEAGQ